MSQFQQTVNLYNTLGFVGGMSFQGPHRSIGANIYSAGVPNYFGNVFTFTSPATAEPTLASPNGGTAKVGGTGVFAGILFNPKENVLNGVTGNPLGASLALSDNSIGDLMQMGYLFVSLPGPANQGDLVTYDPATGALNSITPTTMITASIAAGGGAGIADVLTVTAVAAGNLAVGQLITGLGVEGGTFILSLGTGTGNTGTYNLSTINQQTVSSRAMTAPNVPAPAFSASVASIAGTTLTITTLSSGEVLVGQQIFGTGITANTVIIGLGSGTGGTGTYTVNQSQTVGPIAITGPTNLFVPNCTVERYAANTAGGVAVIKLTN